VDSSELEKRPLLVSWQDGLVESVCPHHDDPAWAVNIKRGVLSMLQHTSQFLDVSEKNVVEVSPYHRHPVANICKRVSSYVNRSRNVKCFTFNRVT